MFSSEQDLRGVSHTDLNFLLHLEDPELAVAHLELSLLALSLPSPGLRPSLHCRLPGPPPGELLVHVGEGEVPVLPGNTKINEIFSQLKPKPTLSKATMKPVMTPLTEVGPRVQTLTLARVLTQSLSTERGPV